MSLFSGPNDSDYFATGGDDGAADGAPWDITEVKTCCYMSKITR